MPRPSHLSSDNILRFLQLRRDPASTDDIAAGLHMRRTERNALYKLLNTLKRRRAIEELPGGRYRLAGRKEQRVSRMNVEGLLENFLCRFEILQLQ